MISKNSPLPMWLAPFLGVAVGAGLGLTTATKAGDANISISAATIGGAVIGGIAGLIVLLVELKRLPKSSEAEMSVASSVSETSATTASPQSGIVRFGTTVFFVIILFSGIITEVYQLPELRRARSSVNWPKVKAQIVEFKTYEQSRGRRQSNPSFLILPSFRYTVDGTSYIGTRWRFGSNSVSDDEMRNVVGQYSRGTTADAYYDPQNPFESVLVPGARTSQYVGVMLIGPLMILAGAAGVYFLVLRPRSDATRHQALL